MIGLVIVAQRLQRGLELGLADAELLGETARACPRGARGGRGGSSCAASGTPARASPPRRRSPWRGRRAGRRGRRGCGGPCLRSESKASSTLDLLTPSLAARSPARSPRRSLGSGRSLSSAARTLASLMPSALGELLDVLVAPLALGLRGPGGRSPARRAARPRRRRGSWSQSCRPGRRSRGRGRSRRAGTWASRGGRAGALGARGRGRARRRFRCRSRSRRTRARRRR